MTFDLYCYLYGSTIVAMITLPPEVLEGGIAATVSRLKNPAVRMELQAAFANPRFPIETMRLASLPHPDWQKYEGMTLPEAAGRRKQSLVDFTCDLLVATNLAAG